MLKYRILEKKGEYKKPSYLCPNPQECDPALCKQSHIMVLANKTVNKNGDYYVPRFVVQENQRYFIRRVGYRDNWVDLKEFSDLQLARDYKRELELIEGIVIE